MPDRGPIAYLTSQYGRAADTFVRGEVAQLRRLGFEVRTYSVRRPPAGEVVAEDVRREQEGTTYLLDRSFVTLLWAGVLEAVRSPGRFLGALRLALRTSAPGVRGRLWGLAYLLEAALLVRVMRQDGIRHLHNHMAEASANVAMLASALGEIPYSLTIHGPSVFYAAGRWALGEKIARARFAACITSFCRSQCMMFAAPDTWDRLHVIRCGLDASFLAAEPTPVPSVRRFVSVARLAEQKGQMILVEAARRLRSEGRDFEVRLVGDGPLRGMLEKAIRAHGLEACVKITGWMGSDLVRAEILAARAFVLPSFAEGLPVVIMEALALGRPVLTTSIAGVPELVRHGESGWLFPAGSVEALVEAMRDALDCPEERLTSMGRAGAERVRKLHDGAREAERLAALLDACISRQAPEPCLAPRAVEAVES